MPDSCTHIAGECSKHEALRIGRHNAACQLIHAAIRKTAKGGGALHSAKGIVLVAADTGTLHQTKATSLDTLSSHKHSLPHDDDASHDENTSHQDWLDISNLHHNSNRRHTDVSQEPRYTLGDPTAAEGDAECTEAPRRIP